MNLALFDFDGTITKNDSLTRFLLRSTNTITKVKVFLSQLHWILGYKMGIVPTSLIRVKLIQKVFNNADEDLILKLGKIYAKKQIPKIIRKKAKKKLKWHKKNGDKIVCVSASLNVYLKEWCRKEGIELICNTLEVKDGRFTGELVDGDCYGEEKQKRVLEKYELNDFEKIYAYGDTEEDKELLSIADIKYYKWKKLN